MPPAGCTRRCWSRTRRTTWWCWCSRAAPRAGCARAGTPTCAPCTRTGSGDDTIVAEARAAAERGERVTVVTADRFLAARCSGVGAMALSPSWLLSHL